MTTPNLAGRDKAAAPDTHEAHAPRPKSCATVLVADSPSDTDKFGTHGRVARAIADLITSGADAVSVGVEGNWGSGKTTIYKLLVRHFAAEDETALVLFDAWAHEGDPLRLTFLQAVFGELRKREGWLAVDDRQAADRKKAAGQKKAGDEEPTEGWEKRLQKIANRRETKITKDYPQLSGAGKAFSIGLLFVPLSIAFANAALRDEKLTLFEGDLSPKFVLLFGLALLLGSAPLFGIALKWFSMSKREREDSASVWSLLFNRGVDETRTETIKSANPTSVDFEATFEQMMDEALGGTRRRVVIVLDNLDRVDSEDALVIWSTLQTFLKHRSVEGADWAKRLWIIALYDPHGLSLVWENQSPASAERPAATEDGDGAAPDGRSKPGAIAHSFMDKSFQVRFEVAAPVLSNWRDFLIELLREAFPDHGRQSAARGGGADGPTADTTDEDFHAVYRVLAIHLNRERLLPTIRELKLYVNQIGAIHRQWAADPEASPPRAEDAFTLPHIAYYALLRRRGRNVVRGLLARDAGEKLPEQEYVDLLGEGITDSLAALAFNVEVKLARQLLIGPELKNALGQSDPAQGDAGATLKALAAAYPKGFWEVLEDTVREEWTDDERTKVAYAAHNLETSGLLDNVARPEVKNVTDSLCNWAGKVSKWSPLDEAQVGGLDAIIGWKQRREANAARRDDFVRRVLRAAAAGFEDATDDKEWSRLIKLLREKLRARGSTDIFDDELVGRLAGPLTREGSQPAHEDVAARLEALTELRDHVPLVAGQLRDMATNGHLLRHVPAVSIPQTDEAAAWVAFTYLRENLTPRHQAPAPGLTTQGFDTLAAVFKQTPERMTSHFAELVKRYGEMGLLFEMEKAIPDIWKFVGACLNLILTDGDATHLPPAELAKKWRVVRGVAEALPTLGGHVARLVAEHGLTGYLQTHGFVYELAGLYDLTIQNGGASDPQFLEWLAHNLKTVEEEIWEYELMAEGDLILAALRARGQGADIRLGIAYRAALIKHAAALMRGDALWGSLTTQGPADLLLAHLRESFQTKLYDMAAERDGSIAHGFFTAYGDTLLEANALVAKDGSYADLLTPLVRKRNAAGIRWMEQVFDKYPKLKTDGRQEQSIKVFRDALKEQQGVPAVAAKDLAILPLSRLARIFELPQEGGEQSGPPG